MNLVFFAVSCVLLTFLTLFFMNRVFDLAVREGCYLIGLYGGALVLTFSGAIFFALWSVFLV